MMDLDEAKRILAAFEREHLEYVLIGSIEVAVRAGPERRPDHVQRPRRRLPAVEYTPPHGLYSMDILSRLGEAFRYEMLQCEEVDLEGVRVRVATPAMLYRMKKDTVRAQDRLDAEALASASTFRRASNGSA